MIHTNFNQWISAAAYQDAPAISTHDSSSLKRRQSSDYASFGTPSARSASQLPNSASYTPRNSVTRTPSVSTPDQGSSYSYQWQRPIGGSGAPQVSVSGPGVFGGDTQVSDALNGPLRQTQDVTSRLNNLSSGGALPLGLPGLSTSEAGLPLSGYGASGLPLIGGITNDLPALSGGSLGSPLSSLGSGALGSAGSPLPSIGASAANLPIVQSFESAPKSYSFQSSSSSVNGGPPVTRTSYSTSPGNNEGPSNVITGPAGNLPVARLVESPANLPASSYQEVESIQSPSGNQGPQASIKQVIGTGFVNDDKIDGIVHKIRHQFQHEKDAITASEQAINQRLPEFAQTPSSGDVKTPIARPTTSSYQQDNQPTRQISQPTDMTADINSATPATIVSPTDITPQTGEQTTITQQATTPQGSQVSSKTRPSIKTSSEQYEHSVSSEASSTPLQPSPARDTSATTLLSNKAANTTDSPIPHAITGDQTVTPTQLQVPAEARPSIKSSNKTREESVPSQVSSTQRQPSPVSQTLTVPVSTTKAANLSESAISQLIPEAQTARPIPVTSNVVPGTPAKQSPNQNTNTPNATPQQPVAAAQPIRESPKAPTVSSVNSPATGTQYQTTNASQVPTPKSAPVVVPVTPVNRPVSSGQYSAPNVSQSPTPQVIGASQPVRAVPNASGYVPAAPVNHAAISGRYD